MKNRRPLIFIAALLALTVVTAAWHLNTRTETAPGTLTVVCGNTQTVLHGNSLPLIPVQGIILNGKGEQRNIDAQGVSVPDLLALSDAVDAQRAVFTASDEYSAKLTIEDFPNAFLILENDSFRLVVFGDPDSRRNVSNVVEVIIE